MQITLMSHDLASSPAVVSARNNAGLERQLNVKSWTPKLNFSTQDLRYILRVFLEGVLLFTPLLERAIVLQLYV